MESINQHLQEMGYNDIHYSMKMVQGPFLQACGLKTFYFLGILLFCLLLFVQLFLNNRSTDKVLLFNWQGTIVLEQ